VTITSSLLSAAPPPQVSPIGHNRAGCTVTTRERQAVGAVYLQGRGDHSGVQILADGSPVATSAADGSYGFSTPGATFSVTVTIPGYVWAERLASANYKLTAPSPWP